MKCSEVARQHLSCRLLVHLLLERNVLIESWWYAVRPYLSRWWRASLIRWKLLRTAGYVSILKPELICFQSEQRYVSTAFWGNAPGAAALEYRARENQIPRVFGCTLYWNLGFFWFGHRANFWNPSYTSRFGTRKPNACNDHIYDFHVSESLKLIVTAL